MTKMKIKIDVRERELIPIIQNLNEEEKKPITIEVENLPLGDIIICEENEKTGEITEHIIIERKKVSDLAASITDGRYNEQSYRLDKIEHPNHNIVYLIEGRIDTFNSRYSRITPTALYTSLTTINYFKGFSVWRSLSMQETAVMIIRSASKIGKMDDPDGYYSDSIVVCEEVDENEVKKNDNTDYSHVAISASTSRVKKDHLTPENIGHIILSQIPGVSASTSDAILNKFGSLYDLLFALKEDQQCLRNITYITKKGQERRITTTAISNIINYLLYRKSNILSIET